MSGTSWSRRAIVTGWVLMLGLAVTVRAQEQQPGSPDGGFDQATGVQPGADPPSRVARLSVAQGNVSVEPASVNEFSAAEVNEPLTTGDRVWADNGAVAELEAGQLAVRVGQNTDLTLTALTDTLAQFGLAQGSAHVRAYALEPETTTELDTPNVAVTLLQPADVRVDVDPNGQWTIVTVFSGQAEIDGNGLQQTLGEGQSVRLAGSDPVSAQWLQLPASDPLDNFSRDRDQQYEAGLAAGQGNLNPDTVGGADLEQYGSWEPQDDYGSVWFTTVTVGWQPYCSGRWTWVAPWGWTWVESEPWGFAPFHYGRWGVFGGRWGWIPGPPVVHPVYAPALVVFVHPGNGLSAWFPLGPNEPYSPWYHSSTLYLNRVNVTNIYTRNDAQVRSVYRNSNREMYAGALDPQQGFVNRARATVAVPQASLAGGRPVRQAQVHLSAEQLSSAPVLPHPLVTPERGLVAPEAARAVPPHSARPALASHHDQAIRAGARPQPGNGNQPGGQPAPIERRGYNGAPGGQDRHPASAAPSAAQSRSHANPQPSNVRPSSAGEVEGGVQRPSPARGTERLPQQGSPAPPAQMGEPTERPQLYNRAVPPAPRPSFDEQRQAIQSTDPGRPLSPQQMENLRENRPAGQPETREETPHPAPAPRAQPQGRSTPPPPSKSDKKH